MTALSFNSVESIAPQKRTFYLNTLTAQAENAPSYRSKWEKKTYRKAIGVFYAEVYILTATAARKLFHCGRQNNSGKSWGGTSLKPNMPGKEEKYRPNEVPAKFDSTVPLYMAVLYAQYTYLWWEQRPLFGDDKSPYNLSGSCQEECYVPYEA